MPLYMDTHHQVEGLTAEAVAAAHTKNLEVQDKYGVKYLRYWYNFTNEPAVERGFASSIF